MVTAAIDTTAIKSRIDLVELAGRDVRLKKVATTRGGEWAGACPFCGGRDRFRVQPKSGLWFCRHCSPGGRWQDAIAFVQRRDGVPFIEACRELGASASELGAEPLQRQRFALPTPPMFAETVEPPAAWQARAVAFIDFCQRRLWTDTGARARAYLAGRGLLEETLRAWRVGFHDADRREPAASWGLEGEDVWLPHGITLPWLTGSTVWQLKLRRPTSGRNKYASVRGGHPLLFGADTLVPGQPAVMTEGELDTLLVWQAVHDHTGTVSLGSASQRPTRLAALLLAQASLILAAYDNDRAGDDGFDQLRRVMPAARRIAAPSGNDVGEFVAAGGRVKAWITFELRRAELVEVPMA
jgi:DNA primase